ncbi:DUF3842 family protein [Desulfobacterium sp. N47]|uniref:DUF3842 family protein n=1 Tax=uncultured Desulfobacterium sp. TaxID=201089 RepID=E1YBS6_9BACT|nr:hypothetical protein N47_G33440 [uncultured Desulfobacterium sp.]
MSEGKKIKRICVIDGQGGGIGSAIIKRLREVVDENVEILALGTNAIATSQMLKAGANRGASGENSIIHTVKQVDIVIGPIGIILANAMMGEVTPEISQSVSACGAKKLLLPLSQENIEIIGVSSSPFPHLIEEMIEKNLKEFIKKTSE